MSATRITKIPNVPRRGGKTEIDPSHPTSQSKGNVEHLRSFFLGKERWSSIPSSLRKLSTTIDHALPRIWQQGKSVFVRWTRLSSQSEAKPLPNLEQQSDSGRTRQANDSLHHHVECRDAEYNATDLEAVLRRRGRSEVEISDLTTNLRRYHRHRKSCMTFTPLATSLSSVEVHRRPLDQ